MGVDALNAGASEPHHNALVWRPAIETVLTASNKMHSEIIDADRVPCSGIAPQANGH
jgi:hypothetical protein